MLSKNGRVSLSLALQNTGLFLSVHGYIKIALDRVPLSELPASFI